jgi:hypothetical protein
MCVFMPAGNPLWATNGLHQTHLPHSGVYAY